MASDSQDAHRVEPGLSDCTSSKGNGNRYSLAIRGQHKIFRRFPRELGGIVGTGTGRIRIRCAGFAWLRARFATKLSESLPLRYLKISET
jgi:hypothetical protein